MPMVKVLSTLTLNNILLISLFKKDYNKCIFKKEAEGKSHTASVKASAFCSSWASRSFCKNKTTYKRTQQYILIFEGGAKLDCEKTKI